MTDKCNVVVFCDNTSNDYIERNLSPRLAVEQARVIINRNHPAINKVIITDSGDCTTFQWERGKGVVSPQRRR